MAKLYRIFTEHKDNLITLGMQYFPNGFTVIQAKGVWNGLSADTTIIEVQTIDEIAGIALANAIKVVNNQKVVLVQVIPVENVYWV